MKMKNKGFGILILIIAIFVIVAGIGGAYIIKNINTDSSIVNLDNAQSSKIESMDIIKTKKTTTLPTQNDDIVTNLDKDSKEVFKGQPGYIKSIVKKENLWVLDVDFVTSNPNWHLYGTEGYSPDEPFYLNQNPKIRSFNVTNKTKLGRCSFYEDALVDVKIFMKEAQEYIAKNIEPGYLFDTNGSEAVSIMEVCVP